MPLNLGKKRKKKPSQQNQVNKERYLIIIDEEEKSKLVSIEAPNYQIDQPVALQTLQELIKYLRMCYTEPLIQVRTLKMTGPQLETLFDTGAKSFSLLTKKSSQS
jgi:hypothetical protein